MQEAVSAVLQDRSREAEGLSRMLVVSLALHVSFVGAMWATSGMWGRASADPEVPIMTISIGGPQGPDTGGRTAMADRAVQAIAKPDAPKAIETPPAAKPPEMVEPDRIVKPPSKPSRVEKPAADAKVRPPTTGEKIQSGTAKVRTGGVPGFGGLATSAQGGGGDVRLDVQNFCCPEYIALMRQRIQQHWNPNMGAAGQPEIKFTIRRDGMITQVEVSKASGQALLDLEARRAVLKATQLPALPREFTGNHLTVYLVFDFKR